MNRPWEPPRYDREFVILLRNYGVGTVDASVFPEAVFPQEIICGKHYARNHNWPRKWGRRGRIRLRLKGQTHHRFPLPTILPSNVQSLVRSAVSLGEPRLRGFPVVLTEALCVQVRKSLDGGVCFYVSKNSVIVRESLLTPEYPYDHFIGRGNSHNY